jgi:methionyl aminopeptidase
VHGDNCATVIVGDRQEKDEGGGVDWRGVPFKMTWETPEHEARIRAARRLIQATREGLYAGIEVCRPGACLSDIGNAIHEVADAYEFDTVRKYRGHGIADVFHTAPYVKVRRLVFDTDTGHDS